MPQWIEIVIRSFSIIIGLFLITKLLGKKQLSKLSFFEYIVGITIGDIAGTLSMDPDLQIKNGVTSILIWSLFPLVTSRIALKSKMFRNWIEGNPTVFVQDGKILEDNLRKEKYTTDELLEQFRKKNVFHVEHVQYATLESNGELNILLKKEHQPVTYCDLFSHSLQYREPQTVIMDGNILNDPLAKIGLSKSWLKAELEKKNVLPKNVFLAQVDSLGKLWIDLYDDEMKDTIMDEKQLILAALNKSKANFDYLTVLTNNVERKNTYIQISKELQYLQKKLEPLLK
ncbi:MULTISPECIES: DUF421 domain-containing protein [Bacillus]|uniref:DUF421 domain-containing protein n=1 Tax=Bacillus TaxID=1386 RepID=UPI000BB8867A|nr:MULTISPECIES: DUF421 domain-containing protein [Bacillus]